ncbi:MAG: hypothetical protein MUE72_08355 [Chitinophagaceae bacterium]|jgi:hypothetical protein|nr:hypothetical protein [Chitinophagaceae bacterium]
MEKLQFTIQINASAEVVYKTMLGLEHKNTYEYWTSAFNPTSTYEGNWDKASKMYFVGTDEEGKKGGMVSEIAEHQPAELISIRHYGFLEGENEITTGEMVEKWAGGFENYSYTENEGLTTVTVHIDVVTGYLDYFNTNYPLALEKLKEITEK